MPLLAISFPSLIASDKTPTCLHGLSHLAHSNSHSLCSSSPFKTFFNSTPSTSSHWSLLFSLLITYHSSSGFPSFLIHYPMSHSLLFSAPQNFVLPLPLLIHPFFYLSNLSCLFHFRLSHLSLSFLPLFPILQVVRVSPITATSKPNDHCNRHQFQGSGCKSYESLTTSSPFNFPSRVLQRQKDPIWGQPFAFHQDCCFH
jgi:hypothetical protein